MNTRDLYQTGNLHKLKLNSYPPPCTLNYAITR